MVVVETGLLGKLLSAVEVQTTVSGDAENACAV